MVTRRTECAAVDKVRVHVDSVFIGPQGVRLDADITMVNTLMLLGLSPDVMVVVHGYGGSVS